MRVHRSSASGSFDLSKLMPQADPSRLRARSQGPEGGVPRLLSLTANLSRQAHTFSPPRPSPPVPFSPPVDHLQLQSNFSNAPSIPHFKEPEPETDDVPSTSSIVVVSPAPNSQSLPTPPTEPTPIALPTPELTPQPTPDKAAADQSVLISGPAPVQEHLPVSAPASEPEVPAPVPEEPISPRTKASSPPVATPTTPISVR